jgi:NADH-quinone oxidoreductase subunit M
MIVLLLILIPLLGGLISFFLKGENAPRVWTLLLSFATLAAAIGGLTIAKSPENLQFSAPWMGSLGSSFTVQLDGMAQVLCLLTVYLHPWMPCCFTFFGS